MIYVNQVLKKEYEWLKEVDKFALTNSVYNMDFAYQMFFKKITPEGEYSYDVKTSDGNGYYVATNGGAFPIVCGDVVEALR